MTRSHSDEQDARKRRWWALLAALLYLLTLGSLIALLTFRVAAVQQDEMAEGLIMNFGTTETGFGSQDLAASNESADAASSSQAAAQASATDIVTQDREPAPTIPAQRQPTTETSPRPQQNQPAQADNQPVEQPRQVNQRALFPGRTVGSNASSEGIAGGAGNQGNPAGDPSGSHDGTGTGNGGVSYSLAGRSLGGPLHRPAYDVQEEGRVIIEIRVDNLGNVVSASFQSIGSTTTNRVLVAAAERAARQTKFSVKEDAPMQTGTITYNFRLQ